MFDKDTELLIDHTITRTVRLTVAQIATATGESVEDVIANLRNDTIIAFLNDYNSDELQAKVAAHSLNTYGEWRVDYTDLFENHADEWPPPDEEEADHDARPDDDPEPGDRCKDCGKPITWTGPSHNDWDHTTDKEN